MLTKQDLLNQKLRTKEIFIPEFNDTVRIREMNAYEGDKIDIMYAEASASGSYKELIGVSALMAAFSLVDENGERLFSDDEVKEVQKFSKSTIGLIIAGIKEINDISDDEVEEALKK